MLDWWACLHLAFTDWLTTCVPQKVWPKHPRISGQHWLNLLSPPAIIVYQTDLLRWKLKCKVSLLQLHGGPLYVKNLSLFFSGGGVLFLFYLDFYHWSPNHANTHTCSIYYVICVPEYVALMSGLVLCTHVTESHDVTMSQKGRWGGGEQSFSGICMPGSATRCSVLLLCREMNLLGCRTSCQSGELGSTNSGPLISLFFYCFHILYIITLKKDLKEKSL